MPIKGRRARTGRKVFGRAAEGRGAARVDDVVAAEAKVRDVHVALGVEQHVFGLEVAVHDVDRVQVRERAHELGGEEAHHGLGEDAEALEVEKELAAAAAGERYKGVEES